MKKLMLAQIRVPAAVTLTIFVLVFLAGAVSAHGVDLTYESRRLVEITAVYSTGEPLSGGQVAVFAPDDPVNPWLTGTCDENGRFAFVPDCSLQGTWEIQVRLAGHGGLIRFEVGEDDAAVVYSTGFNALQKSVMTATTLWGFVGTALFFSRRKTNASA